MSSTNIVVTITADDRITSLIEPNIRYTSEKKSLDNVVKFFTFVATGKSRTWSSNKTGISIHTTNKWAREDWYHEVIDLIKEELDEQLDGVLTNVVHKAADETMERLNNGDEVFDKSGNLVRKKVSARDAMMIAAIAQDKRSLMRGKPTSISETVSDNDRLNVLADKFRAIGEGRDITDHVVCERTEGTCTDEAEVEIQSNSKEG